MTSVSTETPSCSSIESATGAVQAGHHGDSVVPLVPSSEVTSGLDTVTIAMLVVGACAPVVFLVSVAAVLRYRRMRSGRSSPFFGHRARRLDATYAADGNGLGSIDMPPLTTSIAWQTDIKASSNAYDGDGIGDCRVLTEKAVREFFNVQPSCTPTHAARQTASATTAGDAKDAAMLEGAPMSSRRSVSSCGDCVTTNGTHCKEPPIDDCRYREHRKDLPAAAPSSTIDGLPWQNSLSPSSGRTDDDVSSTRQCTTSHEENGAVVDCQPTPTVASADDDNASSIVSVEPTELNDRNRRRCSSSSDGTDVNDASTPNVSFRNISSASAAADADEGPGLGVDSLLRLRRSEACYDIATMATKLPSQSSPSTGNSSFASDVALTGASTLRSSLEWGPSSSPSSSAASEVPTASIVGIDEVERVLQCFDEIVDNYAMDDPLFDDNGATSAAINTSGRAIDHVTVDLPVTRL